MAPRVTWVRSGVHSVYGRRRLAPLSLRGHQDRLRSGRLLGNEQLGACFAPGAPCGARPGTPRAPAEQAPDRLQRARTAGSLGGRFVSLRETRCAALVPPSPGGRKPVVESAGSGPPPCTRGRVVLARDAERGGDGYGEVAGADSVLEVFMRRLLVFCLPFGCASAPADTPKPADSGEELSTEDTAVDDTLRGAMQLSFPLADPAEFDQVIGMDHDPVVQDDMGALGAAICDDYLGRAFPYCYDEHEGSDFILAGSWAKMDAGSVDILAAADGVVVETVDGNYDRCHADLSAGDVSCDGYEMKANRVTVEHEAPDGSVWRTRYLHMMKDSVAVTEGQVVSRGTVLGKVGSSGRSSFPHLHLELQKPDGEDWIELDPYAGPFSQPETYWCEQGDEEGLPGGCP
jgi:murein DD-endopeptidase MepM/ murein hydrolase activator NlpD